MIKTSVIMICTRKDQYEEAKIWIEKQSIAETTEIIALDNYGNKNYTSAAKALNQGAEKAAGEYLIFMHQDVCLWDLQVLERCVNYLEEHDNHIVGVAGIRESDKQACFDISMTLDRRQYAFRTDNKFVPAITLDECFLAMKRSHWEKLSFDEETCDNWHFYGADITMSNKLSGGSNVIMPAKILHASFGVPSGKGFRKSARKIAKKYKGKTDRIITTCLNARCSPMAVNNFFIKRKIKNIVKKIATIMLKSIGLYSYVLKKRKEKKRKKGLFVLDD